MDKEQQQTLGRRTDGIDEQRTCYPGAIETP